MKKQSKLFTWNWHDLGKGLIMAFVSAFFTALMVSVQGGHLPTTVAEWSTIGTVSVIATITYLSKQFFTGTDKKEPGL